MVGWVICGVWAAGALWLVHAATQDPPRASSAPRPVGHGHELEMADSDIAWVNGGPSGPPLSVAAAAAAVTAALVLSVAVFVVVSPRPTSLAGDADRGVERGPVPAGSVTTTTALEVPYAVTLALRCGDPGLGAEVTCLRYLAAVDDVTLRSLAFFCGGGAGDPKACAALRTASRLNPAAAGIS